MERTTPIDLLLNLSIVPYLGANIALPVDIGVWKSSQSWTPRIAVSARYEIPMANQVTVYPKTGLGWTFGPLYPHFSFESGINYYATPKLGFSLGVGILLLYRESERRANWYTSSAFASFGILL